MHFLTLYKISYNCYRISFSNSKDCLINILKDVLYDNTVFFNHQLNNWIIYKKDLDKFLLKHKNVKITSYLEEKLVNIGSNMKLKPYLYQKEAIQFAIDTKNALIILPCGSGKTAIGIGLYLELIKNKIINGKGLIVVKASLKYQWNKEVEKFSNLKSTIIETPSKAKKKFLNQFNDSDLFILNYETLKNDEVIKNIKKMNIEYIFCDEIHYINNHDSDRTKALYKLKDVKIKVGATATPITNNPSNLFGIFNFINEQVFTDWRTFSKNFLKYCGYRKPPKPKNKEKLKQLINPYMFVKTKEEISDQLPKITIIEKYIEISNKISEMNENIMNELDEQSKLAESIENKLKPLELENDEKFLKCKAKIMALQTFAQEIVDSPKLLLNSESEMSKKYYVEEESPKLKECMTLVSEILDSGEKVCIFTKFERMQLLLEEELKKNFKIKIAKINGSLNSKDRYIEAYDKFRDNDEYKVLLGTDAMSEGVNLTCCKYLIEYELANSYAIQTQRHGRLERADSIHSNVFVYQLIMKDSWDEIQQKIISKKENYDFELIKNIESSDINYE